MNRKSVLMFGVVFFLVSCAIITVNIYFPEKDVKEAYKALEKELMTPGDSGPEKPQEGKTESRSENRMNLQLVSVAFAQESGLAENIAQIIKRMPDVVNAYKEMGARIGEIDRLRDTGAAGEGKEGLLVARDDKLLKPADRQLMAKENENRTTVITGMAKAIVRTNRLPENDQNLRQVMPQAAETFAALRRDNAKKGWWIQDPSGNWVRK